METVLVYVGDWTIEFGWQQKQFIKKALSIPDGQEINPNDYQSHFIDLDHVDKLEQVYRGSDVQVHCFIRANPILQLPILKMTKDFASVYTCHTCVDQGDSAITEVLTYHTEGKHYKQDGLGSYYIEKIVEDPNSESLNITFGKYHD